MDIAGVRTKRQSYFGKDDAAKSEKPVVREGFYLFAERDVDIGGGKIALKAYTWTRFSDWQRAATIREIASQKRIQIIMTKNPPKDVR